MCCCCNLTYTIFLQYVRYQFNSVTDTMYTLLNPTLFLPFKVAGFLALFLWAKRLLTFHMSWSHKFGQRFFRGFSQVFLPLYQNFLKKGKKTFENSLKTFIMQDSLIRPRPITPMMANWFMVSRPEGVMISALKKAVINFWKAREERGDNWPVEYFWSQRLFSNIMSSDNSTVRNAFDHTTAISADPFHCLGTDPPKMPSDLTMFKISAAACKLELQASVLQMIHKLYGEAEREWILF